MKAPPPPNGLSARTASDGLIGRVHGKFCEASWWPNGDGAGGFKSRDGCRGVCRLADRESLRRPPSRAGPDAGMFPLIDSLRPSHLGSGYCAVVTIHVGQFPSRGVEPQVAEHAESACLHLRCRVHSARFRAWRCHRRSRPAGRGRLEAPALAGASVLGPVCSIP